MRISDWSSDVCSSDLQIFNLNALTLDASFSGKSIPNGTQSVKFGGDVAYNAKQGAFSLKNGKLQAVDLILTTQIAGSGLNGEAPQFSGPIRSEEHTSELQSLMRISYAVFCLKRKKQHLTSYHCVEHNSEPLTHLQHVSNQIIYMNKETYTQ